jgi:hypothetical protein
VLGPVQGRTCVFTEPFVLTTGSKEIGEGGLPPLFQVGLSSSELREI